VSNDDTNWTTIRTVTGGDGGVDDLTGLSGSGRYVRINGTRRGTQWGYSLWEFEVYGSTAPPPPATTDVVIYAGDIPSTALHGSWSVTGDSTSPNGIKLATTNAGVSNTAAPLSAPADYVDVTFNADASTSYNLWLRLRALDNDKYNDSVWVQFSDATVNAAPVYAMNSTSGLLVNLATDRTAASLSGWGWTNSAYWLTQATAVRFATSGPHTMRIQVREDGVELDQIVLSSTTYASAPPGGPTNDATVVPKP
jgi:hypothetical protein